MITILALDAIKSKHYRDLLKEMNKFAEVEAKLVNSFEALNNCTIEKKESQAVLSIYTVENESQGEALKELEQQTQEATVRLYFKRVQSRS